MTMEGLSQNEKIIWNSWEQKSLRDMVREAAAKGTHINLAIKYLMYKNSWTEDTAKDWFLAEVSNINFLLHTTESCSMIVILAFLL